MCTMRAPTRETWRREFVDGESVDRKGAIRAGFAELDVWNAAALTMTSGRCLRQRPSIEAADSISIEA